jgi:uncharacterized protein
MDEKTFSEIVSVSSNIVEKAKVGKLRKQSEDIMKNISDLKKGVVIIAGVRGSGKTTILTEIYEKDEDSLFVNAEVILRYGVSLLDFLHYAQTTGSKIYLIDEVHALPNWEKDIKTFYDETKEKIIVSGSSAITLKVKGSELSRRASIYETKPLSFREYLIFKIKKDLPVIKVKDILNGDKRKRMERTIAPYIKYFSSYVQFDALPAAFFEKNKDVYINIVERTIRYDLAYLREIDSYYIDNTFRAVKVIATSPPGELSYSGLASSLGVGIKLAKEIIRTLEQTGLVYKIPPFGVGKKAIRKEEKILMPLSFRSALCNYYGINIPKGSLREDFFVQHVNNCFYLKTGKERRTPDFVVGDYIFEVGGPSKGFEQIKDKKNAYIVKESLGLGKREIPLYLFGFLY